MRRAASGRDTGGQRKGARLPRFGLLVYRGSAASGRLGGGCYRGFFGQGLGPGEARGQRASGSHAGGAQGSPRITSTRREEGTF